MSNIEEQIKILLELQKIEMNIIQCQRQIKITNDEAIALDKKVNDRQEMVTASKESLEEFQKYYRQLDSESKANSDLIVKSNVKLRSVKTNKEYQSILKEIEEIRKRNSGIEDQMLEQLDAIEAEEKSVAEKEAELSNFQQTVVQKQEALTGKNQQEQQKLDVLTQQKASVGATADPDVISILEDVRKKVRGQAIVPVEKSICLGCNMNIPAQLFNELQRFDALRFCPHCHRIIFWKD